MERAEALATVGAALILLAIGACAEAAGSSTPDLEHEREIGAACGAYRASEGGAEFVPTPQLERLCRRYGI